MVNTRLMHKTRQTLTLNNKLFSPNERSFGINKKKKTFPSNNIAYKNNKKIGITLLYNLWSNQTEKNAERKKFKEKHRKKISSKKLIIK